MPVRTDTQIMAEAALRSQARQTAASRIKRRARAYARRPVALETIFPGLSAATPETLIAVAKRLIAAESDAPRRWFGFGGEIPLLNAKALLLLGRHLRRTRPDFIRTSGQMLRTKRPDM